MDFIKLYFYLILAVIVIVVVDIVVIFVVTSPQRQLARCCFWSTVFVTLKLSKITCKSIAVNNMELTELTCNCTEIMPLTFARSQPPLLGCGTRFAVSGATLYKLVTIAKVMPACGTLFAVRLSEGLLLKTRVVVNRLF